MELHQQFSDFCIESQEWIGYMEISLLRLETNPGCHATLYDLLRTVEALQKSANLFCMNRVVALADAMEKTLVRLYQGEMQSDEALLALLLSCCTKMGELIAQTSPDWSVHPQMGHKKTEDEILQQLSEVNSKTSWGRPGNYQINATHIHLNETPTNTQLSLNYY